jgi:acyl carrier protein
MNKKDIYLKLIEICRSLFDEYTDETLKIEDSILPIILSESKQALSFVALIEDEFNIEFNDEEVDLEFFSSFNSIESLIFKHLNTNG